MASICRPVFCILVLTMTLPAIKSDDNNAEDNEVVCPADSHSADGNCICAPDRCPLANMSCKPPAVARISSALGVPGSCCDTVSCETPRDKNCTYGAAGCEEGGCPEDSYRLDGVGCQCLPSPCGVKVCPTGYWAKVVRLGTAQPGACCPLYECALADSNSTCTDSGVMRQNGSTWFRGDCTRCRCDSGLIFCEPVGRLQGDLGNCPELPVECSLSRIPAGQCCPVCVSNPEEVFTPPPPGSCMIGLYGKVVLDGEQWQEDPCTSCVCKAGQRQCQAYMCEACANPQYEPGECCPRCNGSTVVTVPSHCPSLNNCSLRCVHGFFRDVEGCFTCHCQQDECLLECPQGFATDQHGNKLCKCDAPRCPSLINCRKSCPHGYKTNKQGCEVCRCDTCKPLDQCTKRCAHGLTLNAKNCVICNCIPHESRIVGNSNFSDTTIGTPCISDNKAWRDDGETWFDGCRQCYCLAGKEMCTLLSCPQTSCANPVYNSSKDCCPSCPDSELVPASHMVCQGERGKVHMEGETWKLSPCVECVCQSGRALCHAASCPPTPCRRPTPPPAGECCPVCPPDQLNNTMLSETCERRGESMWREGNCVSCLCDNGRPSCFTELCEHQVSCNNALQVKNRCCPLCLDKLEAVENKRCTVANTTYTVGQDWREDECTTCVCIAGGEISCTKLVCSVNCPNPIRKPGICCHVCPNNKSLETGREVVYIVVLTLVALTAVGLAFYITRQCRLKRHQLKLHSYGCPPPQYTQYKYMPAYDTGAQPTLTSSEKTSLTPL